MSRLTIVRKGMSKVGAPIVVTLALISGAAVYAAEEVSKSESMAERDEGVPLAKIIEEFSRPNHKHVILDSRVRANVVTYGVDLDHLSYRELETVLAVHGFAAVSDSDGVIRVTPDATVRQNGVPLLGSGKTDLGDAAIVAKVIPVSHLEAAQLVPPLRPLLPQYGHLVAVPGSNSLLVVSRYGDVRSLEALVRELDVKAAKVEVTK